MPRLTNSFPKYRKHRASGQAIVTLDGRDFYLGPHGTKASKLKYDQLVGEWVQNGRRLPQDANETTVVELVAAYWKHAKRYYVKRGSPTDEQAGIKVALRYLKQFYGSVAIAEFGPLSLKNVRQKMLESGVSRGYIAAL